MLAAPLTDKATRILKLLLATQYCDGLRGPTVIYDPDDPYKDEYDIDDENTVITLSDWIHVANPTPFWSNHSLTTLINGKGRTLWWEPPWHLLTSRYRFRLVSISCDAPFNSTINGHKMTIIETDGEYPAPLVVDSLRIYAGQRYSVIVHANQPVNSYWIRADPLNPRGTPGFDNGRNLANLRYGGADQKDSETMDNVTLPLNEDELNCIESPQPSGKPELGGADIHENNLTFDVTGATFTTPPVPVLLQVLNGTYNAKYLLPKGSVQIEDMSSASSTPTRRGVGNVKHATVKNVMPELLREFEGRLFVDIALKNFILNVWGVEEAVLDFIVGESWVLDAGHLEEYDKCDLEPKMYKPFADLSEILLSTTMTRVRQKFFPDSDPQEERSPIFLWHDRGHKTISGSRTTRKPDIMAFGAPFGPEHNPLWFFSRFSIEFKREEKKGSRTGKGRRTPATTPMASIAEARLPSTALPKSLSQLPLSQSVATTATGATSLSSAGIPHLPTASKKRKSSDAHSGQPSKRSRKGKEQSTIKSCEPCLITQEQTQLARYALECLAASPRHYVTGIWIDRYDISLWYFDRACALRTVRFNFETEPHYLALVLYAMNVCDDKHAGFDLHFVLPALPQPGETTPLHDHIVGSEISLPLNEKYPGKGRYRIEETLYAYRGLLGRGTMVYRATPLLDMDPECEPEVLKIFWPVLTRPLEATIIEDLHKALPEKWREHIPEVTYSTTFTAAELKLPRVELLDSSVLETLEDRQQHVLGMKVKKKLWEAPNVEAFMEIFVDCVECHYHAYKEGRVLHRDLSENNLMFKHRPDGNVLGVLNDWDMASRVDENGESQLSNATHRTGTIPFMARDLLVDGTPPPHLYRHDLESFFFILVWAAVYYDFPHGKRKGYVVELEAWDSPSLLSSQDAKKLFILDYAKRSHILKHVTPANHLLLPWIDALWFCFNAAQRDFKCPDNEWDDSTLGGNITFENFMNTIGRAPRG
ncbi:hypothetical protein H0H93_005563 [Arthromyces matolae]|nr:hypothetical protein H0H93_005563 [Arthromyces matolae]